jgi:6-pyruvoyltetrahydropterin/6-carboxytetrahydropterin synthase
MFEITIRKSFAAAHQLRDIGGKCEDLHGHNFTVEISAGGEKLNDEGLLLDFRLLKKWTNELLEELDHKYLNELPFFKDTNPSSEIIARFMFERLSEKTKTVNTPITRVTVWESEDARVSYSL